MSKPWDNEPTPKIDRVANNATDNRLAALGIWREARNLERQLRAANRLVAEVIDGYEAERDSDFDWIAWYEKAKTHIEAARMEDGR